MVRRATTISATLAGLTLLPACERSGDMRDQEKYEPLQASAFFDNGTSARNPVPGTVSRNDWTTDQAFNIGMIEGTFVRRAPIDVDAQLLARGRERFDIYCTPCHAYDGAGHGMVVERGYTAPPSLHTDRLRGAPDGYLFSVISNGLGRMPPYAAQVPTPDRWAIIAYVRALQFSQYAPSTSLTDAQRAELEGSPP